ncbi:Dps family protein, partial [Nonomuraea sp. NPDC004297]
MATITGPLSGDARTTVAQALQGALVDLIDLSLVAKQAHWNLVGAHFRPIHLQLDEVVALARAHMDTIAERAVALGANPDGRAATVARSTKLQQPEGGWMEDGKAARARHGLAADVPLAVCVGRVTRQKGQDVL